MAYSLSIDLNLGAGNAGLTLTPALFDSANSAAAGLTTTTMVEVAASSGSYLWTGTIPDGHRGYISFSSGATFKTKVVLNASEVENPDVKTSTRSSHTAADVWAAGTRTLTSFGTLATDVWAVGTRTLTGFGTLVADVATAVWSAVSRTLTSSAAPSAAVIAAAVWDEPRNTHLALGSFGIADQVVRDGQAQGGGASTLTLDASASATNDFYKNDVVFLKVGTGAGQVNIISGYVGATKVATMLVPWGVTPDATSCFVILPLALIPGASNITSADIWAFPTRTLTGFGTLVVDTAAAVWAYATRTLTMTAAQIVALLDGTTMTITRGQTVSIPITGLGNISARTKLYLTIKDALGDADADAIVQIEETAGLLRLNGVAGTAGQGSLTVTNATTGAITVGLLPVASATLPAPQNYRYDVRMIAGAVVTPLTQGVFTVNPEVTKAIS